MNEIIPALCAMARSEIARSGEQEWAAAADGDLDRASAAGVEGALLSEALKRQEAAR